MEKLKADYLKNLEQFQTSEAVYVTLREAIIQNQMDSALRLKEEELASHLNISRTPIREALLLLQQNDYIVADIKKGYVVKKLSFKESIDIIQYTRFLRRSAAEITAKKITKQQLLLLENKKLTKFQLTDVNNPQLAIEVYKCHQNFHISVAKLTDNNFLYNESVRMHQKLLMMYYNYTNEMRSDFPASSYLQEHEQLLQAFSEHDSTRAKKIVEKYSKFSLVIKHMYKLNRNFDW